MGISKTPRYRMFWSDEFRPAGVADQMTHDRFMLFSKYIHFADNNEMVTDRNTTINL